MKELRKQAFIVLDKYNQVWVDAIKEAEKTGQGLDLTTVISKISEVNRDLNLKFDEAEERNKGNVKKGGFFG